MKLGYFAMPLHRPELLPADTYDQDLEAVCWADKLGYEEAWIGEHYILPYENMPSTDLFIAKALGVTEQIVMGTGVVLLQFHHPVHVAIRIAMLDHLARGRLCFGVGSAAGAHDFALFGLDADAIDPRERIKESIEVILKLWTEDEPFEYQGKYFQVKTPEPALEDAIRFHMKPYQKPHPPIALAGSTPASGSLQLAGQLGWIPMSSGFIHSHFLPTNWETIEKGAAMTGKNPSRSDWRIVREVYVGDNGQKAREEALNGPLGRFFVDYWANLIGKGPRGYGAFKYDPELPDEAITPEYMAEQFWIVGDPDEVTQQIRDLYEKVGGFGTLLTIGHDWERDQKKWHRSMELIAKEVMPALEDLTP